MILVQVGTTGLVLRFVTRIILSHGVQEKTERVVTCTNPDCPLPRFDRSTGHTAFDPVDQSAAGWGTGRRRVESAGHVPDTSFPGSVRKQTPSDPVRSAAPTVTLHLTPPWLQALSPPTRRRLVTQPDSDRFTWPLEWDFCVGSYGRKSKSAHAHVCMQICAHACNHTRTPLCALCLRRSF